MSNQIGSLKMGQKFKKTPAGEIPVDWECSVVSEVSEVFGGGTPDRTNPQYWDGEIFWATPTDVTAVNGATISRTKGTISESGLKNSSANLTPPGSVLMTSRATLGYAVINTVPMATNQGFINFKCSESLHNYFLMYYLRLKAAELERLAAGSTFLEIPKSALRSFFVPIPSLAEQRKIAEIISTIENLCEKVRAEIEKTKELKKGLMQNIFSKAEKTRKLAEMCSLITKGSTPTTYGFEFTNSGVRFIKIESIGTDGEINLKQVVYVSEQAHAAFKRSILEKDDILFSIAGALGRVAIITEDLLPANTNQALSMLRLKKEKAYPWYVKYFLESDAIRKHIKDVGTQGAQINLSLAQVGNINVPLPSLSEQKQIVDILSIIDTEIKDAEKQFGAIQNLKKGLMDMLLTGKIRVH